MTMTNIICVIYCYGRRGKVAIIYYTDINEINECIYSLFYSRVSQERQIKTQKYKYMDDRKRSLCSEIL